MKRREWSVRKFGGHFLEVRWKMDKNKILCNLIKVTHYFCESAIGGKKIENVELEIFVCVFFLLFSWNLKDMLFYLKVFTFNNNKK